MDGGDADNAHSKKQLFRFLLAKLPKCRTVVVFSMLTPLGLGKKKSVTGEKLSFSRQLKASPTARKPLPTQTTARTESTSNDNALHTSNGKATTTAAYRTRTNIKSIVFGARSLLEEKIML